MEDDSEIRVRIKELRALLRGTNSEDVRSTIEAAIADCERKLEFDRTDEGELWPGFAV